MGATLCLDVGNTRAKWQVFHRGRTLGGGTSQTAATDLRIPERIAQLVTHVRLASVAGDAATDAFKHTMADLCSGEVVVLRSEATRGRLRNGYNHPRQLGVDRWLAMVGAEREFGLPIVVVDAGTALTVDGVDSSGAHLGGYIVPGLRSMLQALGDTTAQIPVEVLQGVHDGAVAHSTREAVCNGVVEAARGLIVRAVEQLRGRDGPSPHVVVTGGDRRLVAFPGSGWHVRGDLVMRGIRRVAATPLE